MNNCTSSTYDDDADGVSQYVRSAYSPVQSSPVHHRARQARCYVRSKSDVKSIYERVCLAAHVGADTARPIPSPPSRHQHHHHTAGDIGDIGGNSSWSMGEDRLIHPQAFLTAEAKAGAASSPPPISSRGRLVRLSVWLAGRGSSLPRTCIPAECSSVSRMTAGRKKAALLRRRCAPSSPPTSSSNSSSHHLMSVSAAGRQVCLAE